MINEIKTILLNIIFYPFFIFLLPAVFFIFSFFIILIRLFSTQRQALHWLRYVVTWCSKFTIKILPAGLIKIIYTDYGDIKHPKGVIYVCNHRSASDAFLVGCLPGELVQVVNIWPFRIPILGVVARWAGYLSIREMPFKEFLKYGQKLIKEKVSIVAFPEGTRSKGKAMGHFHGSVFRLAIKTQCPIVPVCIYGNENIPVRGSILLKPGQVKIDKLSAIKWKEYSKLTPFVLKNKVRDTINKHLMARENS